MVGTGTRATLVIASVAALSCSASSEPSSARPPVASASTALSLSLSSSAPSAAPSARRVAEPKTCATGDPCRKNEVCCRLWNEPITSSVCVPLLEGEGEGAGPVASCAAALQESRVGVVTLAEPPSWVALECTDSSECAADEVCTLDEWLHSSAGKTTLGSCVPRAAPKGEHELCSKGTCRLGGSVCEAERPGALRTCVPTARVRCGAKTCAQGELCVSEGDGWACAPAPPLETLAMGWRCTRASECAEHQQCCAAIGGMSTCSFACDVFLHWSPTCESDADCPEFSSPSLPRTHCKPVDRAPVAVTKCR